MRESVLSKLVKCAECGKMTYNKDGFCDECPTIKEDDNDTDSDITTYTV